MGKTHQTFRACVGAVVRNDRGEVLVFERRDRPGSWQLPQGGLETDEEPEAAVLRELEEETGVGPQCVELVETHPDWLAYELPEPARSRRLGRGQVQKWFLFRFTGTDRDIDLTRASSDEFSAWKWASLERVAEQTAPFRRGVYRRLIEAWFAPE
jgi:putative (di)nucleoside polyphosphate hydrolase